MKLNREIDFILLGTVLLTVLVGIVAIYSVSFHSQLPSDLWKRQAGVALFSIMIAVSFAFIPNKLLYDLAYVLYAASLLSLLAVLAWGSGEVAARWLRLGPGGLLTIQPSEFAKIATIIVLARYLADSNPEGINSMRRFLGAMLLALVPMALIARQPDLGTALCFGAVIFPMLYWAGMRTVWIFFILSPLLSVAFSFEPLWQTASPFVFAAFIILSSLGIHLVLSRLWVTVSMIAVNLSAGLITVYLWASFLRDYQKARILTFLDPESDRLNTGWTIIQSKIAIGSGGISGKGFLEGTQTKYEFLPAAHTDFIFSVIGEEFGFVGALGVMTLFVSLIARSLQIGYMAQNRFYGLIAIGIAALVTFHVFVNVGMTIGVMPVTGLPLPFLSYGGSSMTATFIAIGLLLHIYSYRHEY